MAVVVKGKFAVEGLDSLLNKLRDAKGGTQAKAALRAGLRDGAKIVAKAAQAKAPVSTGRLRKSIKVRAAKRSRAAKGQVRMLVTTSKYDNLFKGETFYGAFQEFGTSKIAARPFMRPAFDESKEAASAAVSSRVQSEVLKRMKK